MTLKFSPTLKSQLDAATNRVAWGNSAKNGLGNTLRLLCWRDANASAADPTATGTKFLDCAVSGPLNIDPNTGNLVSFGAISNVTVKLAADLSSGKSVFRIQGNGQYIEGTLGLAGSGADFIFAANPTSTANGVAFAPNTAILGPSSLPPKSGDSLRIAVGATLCSAAFENVSASALTNVPVTFGQPFKRNALLASGAAVALKLGGATVPAQIDVKATHDDGSVRHAVVSAVIPNVPGLATQSYELIRATAATPAPAVVSNFSGLTASVSLNIGGTVYSAALADGWTDAAEKWLSGDVVTEWIVVVPLKTSGGTVHPLLHARFYVRGYKGQNKARVDVIVENTYVKINTSATSGQRGLVDLGMGVVTYDATITVGGTQVYTEAAVAQHAFTRWRKTYWWGGAASDSVVVKHDKPYVVSTHAIPNYDTTLEMSSSAIASALTGYNAKSKLMEPGLILAYMGTTGGREDIAILPGWDVRAFISQKKDAFTASWGTANQAGSFRAHFRNKDTGRPLTLAEAPRFGLTWGGGDSSGDLIDPVTGINWMPYPDAGDNPNTFEVAHHPDPHFLPYLLTGDYYYMEQINFWANAVVFRKNPGYRGSKALVHETQIRAQAWGLRTVAHAAYITPDAYPQKAYNVQAMADNIDFYMERFVNATGKPWLQALGAWVEDTGVPQYNDGSGFNSGTGSPEPVAIAPWQDDHFTSATGRMVELGFEAARPIFTLKAKYVVLRMTSGADFCYQFAGKYGLAAKALSSDGGGMLTTIAQVYTNSVSPTLRQHACGSQALADAMKLDGSPSNFAPGEMFDGRSVVGGATLIQPSIAYAASFGVPGGQDAWLVYSNAPNYRPAGITSQPQFTINPRS